jgi:hypothetical protein
MIPVNAVGWTFVALALFPVFFSAAVVILDSLNWLGFSKPCTRRATPTPTRVVASANRAPAVAAKPAVAEAPKVVVSVRKVSDKTGRRLSDSEKIILDAVGRLSKREKDILAYNLRLRERTAVRR